MLKNKRLKISESVFDDDLVLLALLFAMIAFTSPGFVWAVMYLAGATV